MKKNKKMIEEYEVNPATMLLRPMKYGSKIYTEIYEVDGTFISPFKPLEVIKKSCEFFGISYLERKEGTKRLIGISRKVPIIIDPQTSIYLFPTASPTEPHCIWISHEQVFSHERIEENSTLITFQNGLSVSIPISIKSFENQFFRTSMLRVRYTQRIEKMENQLYDALKHSRRNIEASERKQSYIVRFKKEDNLLTAVEEK